jgi:hypothetical protein
MISGLAVVIRPARRSLMLTPVMICGVLIARFAQVVPRPTAPRVGQRRLACFLRARSERRDAAESAGVEGGLLSTSTVIAPA